MLLLLFLIVILFAVLIIVVVDNAAKNFTYSNFTSVNFVGRKNNFFCENLIPF
jgi:hypothetical protein